MVWAAVVDRRGATIYQMDASGTAIWPGLERKTAAPTLTAIRPSIAPQNPTPPAVLDTTKSIVATFLPMDSSHDLPPGMIPVENLQQGAFQSWWSSFADTGQWKWGSTPAVVKGVPMTWNKEMEASAVSYTATPGIPQEKPRDFERESKFAFESKLAIEIELAFHL